MLHLELELKTVFVWLLTGQMEPAVQAHLECFLDLILIAGAKHHADIQVLGLV